MGVCVYGCVCARACGCVFVRKSVCVCVWVCTFAQQPPGCSLLPAAQSDFSNGDLPSLSLA